VQAHVIVRSLDVSQVIEIYNAAIRQTYKVHGQHWLSGLKQTDKEKPFAVFAGPVGLSKRALAASHG
jgi:hypothetical protein